MTVATAIPPTTTAALLVGTGERTAPISALVRQLGLEPMAVAAEEITAIGSVGLCLIDLHGDGAPLHAIRVGRTRHAHAVIVGLADDDRPQLVGEALRAGAFDVLPRIPARHDLDAVLANARERTSLPPMPATVDDISALAALQLKALCARHGQPLKTLTAPALTLLSALPWQDTGADLQHLLERLVVFVPSGLLRLEDVLAHAPTAWANRSPGRATTLREARARFEHDYIDAMLRRHRGRVADVAQELGIQRTNLYRKMRQLKLSCSRMQDRK